MVDIQLLNDDCWNVAEEVDETGPSHAWAGMDMQIISFLTCPLDKGDGGIVIALSLPSHPGVLATRTVSKCPFKKEEQADVPERRATAQGVWHSDVK